MELDVVKLASYIGIIAFAISGTLTGIRKNFDVLGIMVIAIITVVGGGVVRDILIGRFPVVLLDSTPIYFIVATVILSIIFKIHKKTDVELHLFFVVSDSIGLVAFSIIGATIAIESELEIFGVMGLSFVTAVGGGIIRDILINEIPLVFKSDFYATISLLVAIVLQALHKLELLSHFNILIVFIMCILIRLFAYFNRWQLPRI